MVTALSFPFHWWSTSWDMNAIEKSARGLHPRLLPVYTGPFAPMADIARDPRWGRDGKAPGKTFISAAPLPQQGKGFCGKGLATTRCCDGLRSKYFAAYGAWLWVAAIIIWSIVSLRQLKTHLPPFKAAADANAATFMNSFNDLNGVPATGNKFCSGYFKRPMELLKVCGERLG